MAFIVLLCITKEPACNLSSVKFQYCVKYVVYSVWGIVYIDILPAWKIHEVSALTVHAMTSQLSVLNTSVSCYDARRFLPSIHRTTFGFLTRHQPSCPWSLYPTTDLFQRMNRKKIIEETHLSSSHDAVCIYTSGKTCSLIHKCLNKSLLSAACFLWSLHRGEATVLYNS